MKGIRQNTKGIAMVVVLCIMSLFLALSLSLLYGCGQLSALLDRKWTEEKCYQQALTFSETLQKELEKQDISNNTTFYSYVKDFFEDHDHFGEDQKYTFQIENTPDNSGLEQVSVSLLKTKNGASAGESENDASEANWQSEYLSSEYIIKIYVEVKAQSGESVTVCSVYRADVKYPLVYSYYEEEESGTTHLLTYDSTNDCFKEGDTIIKDKDNDDNKITLKDAQEKKGQTSFNTNTGKVIFIICKADTNATQGSLGAPRFVLEGRM